MQRIIITLLFVLSFSASFLHSQDLYIPNNPYDNAPEDVSKSKAFQRERWFYEQRMFPYNFIPEDAYSKAQEQRARMRETQGYLNDGDAFPWVNLGPTPGFYFSYGNISSRIATVKYHPTTPTTIYLGAANGGIWRSTNSGANWVPMSDWEVSLSSGALAIDPANPNIIYYGTGEATYSGASYYGRGILKSTNGGTNWTNYTAGLPSLSYFNRLVIRPGFPSQLFAATGSSGLYRSIDAGVTWTLAVAGRCDDIVFAPNGTNAYIIGSGTGYRTSVDGGLTFTVNTSIPLGSRNHLAICRDFPLRLYAVVYGGGTTDVYRSINGGTNFTLGYNIPQTAWGWYDLYIHVNPFDPNYVYVGLMNMWRSINGGTSFATSDPGVHVDHHNMDLHPTNSNQLISANDGGVYMSGDRGTTWTNLNATLTLTQFYRIAVDPSNINHILGGTQDNGTQRTTGTINYTAAFGGDGGEVCFHTPNPMYILGETQYNGVYRSINGGVSWAPAQTGLSGSGAWVGPIITHPTTAGVFFTARGQVFRTDNYAASWTAISSGTSGTIRELAISRTNPSIMYATAGAVVYRSVNAGVTFTNVTVGLPSRTISSVYVHPDSQNVAILTYSGFGAGKIYKTTNGSTSWFNISGNLPDSPTNDGMIYYPGFPTSYLLAAMDIGVFMTTNYGTNWTELAAGLPNTVAINLDHHAALNRIRVGTHGRGIWDAFITIIGIISQDNELPKEFGLGQNYPNPFNPSTLLKVSVPKSEFVTLKVYDMLGREVATLVEQQLNPGTYNVMFTANDLSSGVYYYKLTAGDYVDTKKMVLMK